MCDAGSKKHKVERGESVAELSVAQKHKRGENVATHAKRLTEHVFGAAQRGLDKHLALSPRLDGRNKW